MLGNGTDLHISVFYMHPSTSCSSSFVHRAQDSQISEWHWSDSDSETPTSTIPLDAMHPASRPSVVPPGTLSNASSLNQRLLAKKREHDAVTALDENTRQLRETFLNMAEQLRLAEDGAEGKGSG